MNLSQFHAKTEITLDEPHDFGVLVDEVFRSLTNAHARDNHNPSLSSSKYLGDNLADLGASFAGFYRETVIECAKYGQTVAKATTNPLGIQWDSVRLGDAYEPL